LSMKGKSVGGCHQGFGQGARRDSACGREGRKRGPLGSKPGGREVPPEEVERMWEYIRGLVRRQMLKEHAEFLAVSRKKIWGEREKDLDRIPADSSKILEGKKQ